MTIKQITKEEFYKLAPNIKELEFPDREMDWYGTSEGNIIVKLVLDLRMFPSEIGNNTWHGLIWVCDKKGNFGTDQICYDADALAGKPYEVKTETHAREHILMAIEKLLKTGSRPKITEEELRRAENLSAAGEAEGIDFFFGIIRSPPPDFQWPGNGLPAPTAMTRLEESLERSAEKWTDDLLKQALSLGDCHYEYQYQHAWMSSPATKKSVREVARIHYLARQELSKRGSLPVDEGAPIRELIRQIETDYNPTEVRQAIKELAQLGRGGAPAIPALGRYYERNYNDFTYASQAVEALKAIGEEAAPMLRHVEAIDRLCSHGIYRVCGPCECRMERISGVERKCPKCGRIEEDPHS